MSHLETFAAACRDVFSRYDYSLDGLADAFSTDVLSAISRIDIPAIRAGNSCTTECGALVGLFILGDEFSPTQLEQLFGSEGYQAGILSGVLTTPEKRAAVDFSPVATSDIFQLEKVVSAIDVRPLDIGHGTLWVAADFDGQMFTHRTGPDHVVGVGEASTSLLELLPENFVGSVADIGTGSGVQALTMAARGGQVIATDINKRALMCTIFGAYLNGVSVDVREGSWFEPVGAQQVDLLVSNPPFVMSTEDDVHTYRATGLKLDSASRIMVSGAADHLKQGGMAVLLASWAVCEGEDWRNRLSSWLPDENVQGWVLCRDVVDVEHYVHTWMKDEGHNFTDAQSVLAAHGWATSLRDQSVRAIAFGYVFLQKQAGPSSLLCEDNYSPALSSMFAEACHHFAVTLWLESLDANDLVSEVLCISSDTAIHRSDNVLHSAQAAMDGNDSDPSIAVERLTGSRWRHDIDPLVESIIRGCAPGVLALGDIIELAAAQFGVDSHDLTTSTIPVVVDLIRHGILRPVHMGN